MKEVAVAIHAKEDFDPHIINDLENLDYIHVDVMDGKFVNNFNLNLSVFKILNFFFEYPIVAHLMVSNPIDYVKKIINFIDVILFHYESEGNIEEIINKVKDYNKKVGIVINPNTEISNIISYLNKIDYVLVMAVNPGWSGQKFIPATIDKVNKIAQYKKKFKFEIIVDGGINLDNAIKLLNADILSSSSTILNAKDPNYIIEALKKV